MKAFLVYSAMRLGLLIGVGGILYLLGMRDLLLVAVALLVSGLLSFTLLSDQRDQMSAALAVRKAALDERNAARTAAEDAANDAMREAQEARLAGTAGAAAAAGDVREAAADIEAAATAEPVEAEPAGADPGEPEPPRDA